MLLLPTSDSKMQDYDSTCSHQEVPDGLTNLNQKFESFLSSPLKLLTSSKSSDALYLKSWMDLFFERFLKSFSSLRKRKKEETRRLLFDLSKVDSSGAAADRGSSISSTQKSDLKGDLSRLETRSDAASLEASFKAKQGRHNGFLGGTFQGNEGAKATAPPNTGGGDMSSILPLEEEGYNPQKDAAGGFKYTIPADFNISQRWNYLDSLLMRKLSAMKILGADKSFLLEVEKLDNKKQEEEKRKRKQAGSGEVLEQGKEEVKFLNGEGLEYGVAEGRKRIIDSIKGSSSRRKRGDDAELYERADKDKRDDDVFDDNESSASFNSQSDNSAPKDEVYEEGSTFALSDYMSACSNMADKKENTLNSSEVEDGFFSFREMEEFAEGGDEEAMDSEEEELMDILLRGGEVNVSGGDVTKRSKEDENAMKMKFEDFYDPIDTHEVRKRGSRLKTQSESSSDHKDEQELPDQEEELSDKEYDMARHLKQHRDESNFGLEGSSSNFHSKGKELLMDGSLERKSTGDEASQKRFSTNSKVKRDDFGGKRGKKGQSEGNLSKRPLSDLQNSLWKLSSQIDELEKAAVSSKHWSLQGEAKSKERPLNSLLELNVDLPMYQKPSISDKNSGSLLGTDHLPIRGSTHGLNGDSMTTNSASLMNTLSTVNGIAGGSADSPSHSSSGTYAVELLIKYCIENSLFDDVKRVKNFSQKLAMQNVLSQEDKKKALPPVDAAAGVDFSKPLFSLGDLYAKEYEDMLNSKAKGSSLNGVSAADSEAVSGTSVLGSKLLIISSLASTDDSSRKLVSLFAKVMHQLDAMTNQHFVPKPPKIVSGPNGSSATHDVPVVQIEEVVPVVFSSHDRQSPLEKARGSDSLEALHKSKEEMVREERRASRAAKKERRKKSIRGKQGDGQVPLVDNVNGGLKNSAGFTASSGSTKQKEEATAGSGKQHSVLHQGRQTGRKVSPPSTANGFHNKRRKIGGNYVMSMVSQASAKHKKD